MKASMLKLSVNDAVATAQHLRELADRAERGEIIGAAVAVITDTRDIEPFAVGLALRSNAVGHLAASQLADALRYK
jgi:hypothetical protein